MTIKPKKSYMSTLLQLKALVQGISLSSYFLLTFVLILTLIIAFVDVISPTILKKLIDLLDKYPEKNWFSILITYGLLILTGRLLFQIKLIIYSLFERKVFIHLLHYFSNTILRNNSDFFLKKSPGFISSQVSMSIWGIRDATSNLLIDIFPTFIDILFIITSVCIIFDVHTAIIIALGCIIYICSLLLANRQIVRTHLPLRKSMIATTGVLTEIMNLWKDNKLLNSYSIIDKFLQRHTSEIHQRMGLLYWRRLIYNMPPIFILSFLVFSVNYYIINNLSQGYATLGSIVLINNYLWQILRPLENLVMHLRTMSLHWSDFLLGRPFIEHPKETINGLEKYEDGVKDDHKVKLRFFNVSIKNRLAPININFNSPEKVFICGKSGSGKTTFFNILTRINDFDSGEIWLGDQLISALSHDNLRNSILYIPSDPKLWCGSIEDNILLNGFPSDKTTQQPAFKNVQLSKKISEESAKEDHISSLSQGEKQRLILTRIWSRTPKVMLLDEVTSALDPTTERLIVQNLLNHPTPLILFSSHRLSLSPLFDRIIVFAEGRIIEDGTFHDLYHMNGIFYELYRNGENNDHKQEIARNVRHGGNGKVLLKQAT